MPWTGNSRTPNSASGVSNRRGNLKTSKHHLPQNALRGHQKTTKAAVSTARRVLPVTTNLARYQGQKEDRRSPLKMKRMTAVRAAMKVTSVSAMMAMTLRTSMRRLRFGGRPSRKGSAERRT
ncbi:unnamed protein product [Ixodes pacificus]